MSKFNPHSDYPRVIVFTLLLVSLFVSDLYAQSEPYQEVKPVPLLTGGSGLITVFDGGEPHLAPIVSPIVLVPLGQRWLIEARGTFEADLVKVPGESGFHGKVEKALDFAQLDFIANPYMTVSAGRFLTPFNIYDERYYPVWIRNLQTDPLILPIGIGPSDASTGAMVRGGIPVNQKFAINYAAYFSALSTVEPVTSDRFAGGRAGIVVPKSRLEIGGSFQHLLQGTRTNTFGFYGVWQPPALPLDIRGEYARSITGSGYWVEAAYRMSQIPVLQNEFRRTQVVARLQQFFVGETPSDALPPVRTTVYELGVNYYFMDGLRGTGSYGRQFSSEGDKNVWTVGLTYRFVIPLGHAGRE